MTTSLSDYAAQIRDLNQTQIDIKQNRIMTVLTVITSIFMPALIGIVADRWIPAQKMMGICHFISSSFLLGMAYYAMQAGTDVNFGILIGLFTVGIGFYMPSLSLSYSSILLGYFSVCLRLPMPVG